MTTSSRPCLRHCAAIYSASSLLRFDPATWGSEVKMRCWRRSSWAEGMDLNFFSIAVSRTAFAGLNPRMDFWASAVTLADKTTELSARRQLAFTERCRASRVVIRVLRLSSSVVSDLTTKGTKSHEGNRPNQNLCGASCPSLLINLGHYSDLILISVSPANFVSIPSTIARECG